MFDHSMRLRQNFIQHLALQSYGCIAGLQCSTDTKGYPCMMERIDPNHTIKPMHSVRWKRIRKYLLMLVIIAPLMCLKLVDPAVPFLAELTVERLASFAGGLCLDAPSETRDC